MRTGLVAKKIGMSSVFTEGGQMVPVTLLVVDKCCVVSHKVYERDGYNAVVLGYDKTKLSKITKPLRKLFVDSKLDPMRHLKEFRVSVENLLPIGSLLGVDHFAPGAFVDVSAISIGKGFAGGMKRWNFAGLEASHGVSISHRSIGSTGGRQDPGKVFKNKKMPGHLGCKKVTLQNLQIFSMDKDSGLLLIRGSVPGPKGGCVYIKDAIKKTVTI